ncbi:MAG: hypothetical protein ACLFN8_00455 [Candidatus Woesearchaeota archaeon]
MSKNYNLSEKFENDLLAEQNEFIELELREQKKYELPEPVCTKNSFKCAMGGLSFLIGSLTLAGIVSSYNSSDATNSSKLNSESNIFLKDQVDSLYKNDLFKTDSFHKDIFDFKNTFHLKDTKDTIDKKLNENYVLDL